MKTPGVALKAWGGAGPLAHCGIVSAADGEVDIFAIEIPCERQQKFQGGFQLKALPGRTPSPLRHPGLPPIVCMTWDPWSTLWKRKQRLLHDLAAAPDGPAVFYAEPPLALTTIIEDPAPLMQDSDTGRKYRRALSGRPLPMAENFFLHTPLLPLPGARSLPWIHAANFHAAGIRLKKMLYRAGVTRYLLWLYHPSQLWLLEHLGPQAQQIIYDWTDDWVAAFPNHLPMAQKRQLKRDQLTLLQRCDVVFAVSSRLCRRAERYCPNVFHLPNATDPGIFHPLTAGTPLHPKLQQIPTPRLAYLSQITERLDVDLLAALAHRRPDWQILLIGPEICPREMLRPLRHLSNVHLLGPMPYQEAARVVAQCQVSILPHRVDELTATLDPIKLYDYLAVGNPVVSTPVAMHPDLTAHIAIATGCDRFEEAVQAALAEPREKAADRRTAALRHTWKHRSATALSLLKKTQ